MTGSPRHNLTLFQANDAVSDRVTAPVVNTTAGLWTFEPSGRPVIITNVSGQTIYVLVNSATVDAFTTTWTYLLTNGSSQNLSEYGQVNVKHVSIWVPTGGNLAQIHFHVYK